MNIPKWAKITSVVVVIGLIVFAIFQWQGPAKADGPSKKKSKKAASPDIPVHASVVQPQQLTSTLELTGTVIPDKAVALKTEASGRINALPLEEGSRVRKGEHLLTINNAELKAQLKQARQQKQLLKQRLNRKTKLLEQKGISQESYDETKTAYESQKAQIDLLKAKIDKTTIHAPFTGLLGLKNVSFGSYVSPASKVIRIIKERPVKIDFSIPGEYASIIERGQSITFQPSNLDTTLKANVYAIEPLIDQGTRQLKLRARYPNTNGLLNPGSFVDINLNLTTDPDALLIPSIAVIPELDGKKVYVYQNGKTYPRTIKTAQRTGTEVQVVEGLQAGDTVITKGIQKISKGTAVKIQAMEQ